VSRALLYCAGGGIGDSLVASLVARALRRRFAVVDALTLPAHRETLERVPDFDGVLVDDGGDERGLARSLGQRGYDVCVVTWATARTARVPQLARIPVRVGQARRLYSYRFTDRVVVRSELGDVTSHWSDILLDYARAIGCDTENRLYRLVPTPEDRREAESLAGTLGLSLPERAGPFVILNPCNAVASKAAHWPTQGWAALARALRERFGLPVLISGGTRDAEIAQAIAVESGERVESVAGRLGIGAFAALAQSARAFVGISTGSMHVAAAVDCPTIGIFPFQSDFPERWAPLGRATAIVRPVYRCHPGDTKERCRDYACVANLDIPRVLAAVSDLP
jgi:ADP-heptose:LPS heptosyltransferase